MSFKCQIYAQTKINYGEKKIRKNKGYVKNYREI